jgi:DNA-binding beta-propeller fold protein YncE
VTNATGRLIRINARTNRVTARIRLPGFSGPEGAATDGRAVWISNNSAGSVSRYDIRRRKFTGTRRTGRQPRGIALGGGSVWVVNSGSSTVSRVSASLR